MIQIHGKDYKEVKDRVAEAHTDEGFSMLKEETFQMGGREYVRIYIEVKGKQYIGTAECKFNANPKTPDGTSPYECGQTSALGRALGFAGYGPLESIASADEVLRTQAKQPTTNGHKPPENALRLNELFEGGKLKKMWRNRREMLVKVSEMLESTVTDANIGELDSSLLDYIAEVIEKTPQF